MNPYGHFSGTWESGFHKMNMSLPVILFEDSGSQIVYCPALDISGYGVSETEAEESFKIVLGEYLLFTTHKKTLDKDLRRLGWTIKSNKKRIPPTMGHLLEKNENFSNIFNNYPFRKIDKSIELPL